MTQVPPPPVPTTTIEPLKTAGLGKLACFVTFVAGVAIIATKEEQLGQAIFSASLALWGLGFILMIGSFLGRRKKAWAVLALLLNAVIAAWLVISVQS